MAGILDALVIAGLLCAAFFVVMIIVGALCSAARPEVESVVEIYPVRHPHRIRRGVCRDCGIPLDDLLTKGTK